MTMLDVEIKKDEEALAYWQERKAEAERWTPERIQETIDRIELRLHYSRKHREIFRAKKAES